VESPQLITSLSNPLVKKVRALRQRKARAASGLFLVEGIHHVGSALEAEWAIDTLLYAPDSLTSDFAQSLLDDAYRIGVALQPVSAKVMESLTEKDNPQGILAMVKQRSLGFGEIRSFRCGVALVSPQDPGNVGTILRTLDAVGADALFILDGGVELYHPTCVRASMGTIFWKPVAQASFDEFKHWIQANKFQLIGTSAHAQSELRAVKMNDAPWVLLMGSEQKGLSPEQLETCDITVSLPMHGKVSSLNLAVATGIFLYSLKE